MKFREKVFLNFSLLAHELDNNMKCIFIDRAVGLGSAITLSCILSNDRDIFGNLLLNKMYIGPPDL